jgi:hypothetical protein
MSAASGVGGWRRDLGGRAAEEDDFERLCGGGILGWISCLGGLEGGA